MNVLVFGDLIADISLRLQRFPLQAKDIQRLSYLEVGPGGAGNMAIMAARFGLAVSALGEVGVDIFGNLVRAGLDREGVDTSPMQVSPGAQTPVAGVLVDPAGEPAYVGYAGSLQMRSLPPAWKALLQGAQALYADGWAEYPHTPELLLQAFRLAHRAGLLTLFDPGPGNPEVDNAWVREAISLSRVLLLNQEEARRLAGALGDAGLLAALLAMGPQYVVLKRGAQGVMLGHGQQRVELDAFPAEVVDTTGAGDSLSAAVAYGLLHNLPLHKLAVLANATGAAKVAKRGTGHNLPNLDEIRTVLRANGYAPEEFFSG